jgi:GAF domain-containing protein
MWDGAGMPSVNQSAALRLADEIDALRRENEALLRELENAYAQLTAVLQVSQDETRIAYSELQEKLVVQEKKIVEMTFLSSVGEALAVESDLHRLRHLVVEKIALIMPVDLALLQLTAEPELGVQRERDLVREVHFDRGRLEALSRLAEALEAEGRGSLLAADLDADSWGPALRQRPDARSAACLALRAAGRPIGLLVLNSRLRANFRDDQEPLLGAFGHQAAAALAHALRLRRHRDLIVRLMATHGWSGAELERCATSDPPAGANQTELAEVLARLLGREDITRATAGERRFGPREGS